MRELWTNGPLRVYFVMQFVLALGGQFLPVALSWMILHQYHNAALNGLVLSLLVFPRLVVLPFSSVILRWFLPRQQILGLFSALALIMVAWTATQYLFRPAPLWTLMVGTTLVGAVGALSLPMSYSVLPVIAGAEQLEPANAFYQVAIQFSTAIGPLVSGAILLRSSFVEVLGVFAGLLMVATAWGAIRVRVDSDSTPPPFVFKLWNPSVITVLWILCASACINFFLYGPLQVAISTWIDLQHWPVSLLGLTFAAFGAGGAVGALLQGTLRRLRSPFLVWSPAILLAIAWLTLWQFLDVEWALAPIIFAVGIMSGWVTTIMLRAIYRAIPATDLTSVFSLIFFGSALGQVASLDSAGVVLSHTGIPRLMAVAGGGLLCVGIATFIMGPRTERRQGEPGNQMATPDGA